MSLVISGIGTAVPPHRLLQSDAMTLQQDVVCATDRERRSTRMLFRKALVHERNMAIAPTFATEYRDGEQEGDHGNGPTTKERMELYAEVAPELAFAACESALDKSGVSPAEITHLVLVSCTGFDAPGVDIRLIKQLGLPATTQRVTVGFMGCHGAINGLRTASGLLADQPEGKLLLCAVECCSLHYRFNWDDEGVIGNALFADGAAAIVAENPATAISHQSNGSANGHGNSNGNGASSGNGGGVAASVFAGNGVNGKQSGSEVLPAVRLQATGSCLLADSEPAMSWRIGNYGFDMKLANEVADHIRENLLGWITNWLAEQGLTLEGLDRILVHPGGPKILEAAQAALDLSDETVAPSYEILRTHGNMSSPTILFLLKQAIEQKPKGSILAIAFGPGLVAEVALFQAT